MAFVTNSKLKGTDPAACNYDASATDDDGSCLELDCAGDCGGSAVVDECGVCNGPGAIYECGCTDIPLGACNCDGDVVTDTSFVAEQVCDEFLWNNNLIPRVAPTSGLVLGSKDATARQCWS